MYLKNKDGNNRNKRRNFSDNKIIINNRSS